MEACTVEHKASMEYILGYCADVPQAGYGVCDHIGMVVDLMENLWVQSQSEFSWCASVFLDP